MIDSTSTSIPLADQGRFRAMPAASWGAILAGAVVAIAVSLILLTLGSGLGFASVSPWPGRGASAAGFAMAGTIWLIVTQWLSAGVGGYIAGRLRQRWLATHVHEIFFRDTAHGLVTWSVATLVVASVLVGSAASIVGGGMHAAGGLAAAAGKGAEGMGGPMAHGPMGGAAGEMGAEGPGGPNSAYSLDKLFRNASPGAGDAGSQGNGSRMEAMHIAASAAASGNMSDEDRSYLVALVASKAGISPEEAQKRVDAFTQSVEEAKTKAKAAADEARKAAASTALYTALSLLIGAFIASVSAVIGGRIRDEHL
jgi:hypothetical protein